MHSPTTLIVVIVAALLTLLGSTVEASDQAAVDTSFGKLPLYFIENQGQLDEEVAYYIQGSDKSLFFTSRGVTIALFNGTKEEPKRGIVKLDFVNASPDAKPRGEDKQEAIISYFKGKPENWKRGIPTYGRLIYKDLWPGIDLAYSGTVNRLKYEFIVKPGADPSLIRLAYRGASTVSVQENGALRIASPHGAFEDGKPYAYQEDGDSRKEVSMHYALDSRGDSEPWTYGFNLGAYDRSKPLILDPVLLVYSGFIGGAEGELGYGIAVDTLGNAYVAGKTKSWETSFPVLAGPDLTHSTSGSDGFVAKISADGASLLYCGYIGGSASPSTNESCLGIAVDQSGCAYVTGVTHATEVSFPVTIGPGLTYNGDGDCFVAKVNALGTGLDYCGYIGGDSYEVGLDIAVDLSNNAYVTGFTASGAATFPDKIGPDTSFNGGAFDAFVAKVDPSGQTLAFCGYIGGNLEDSGQGVAVDELGACYVTGYSNSSGTAFPVSVGPDLTYNGGSSDAFVAKIHTTGNSLEYCGYIGGADPDGGLEVAVDSLGCAFVIGVTRSSETTFPVLVGPDRHHNGNSDAFVAKVNPTGSGLYYCGYIGGANLETGVGIAIDSEGRAHVIGYTSSDETSFPVKLGPDLTFNGWWDGFLARVDVHGLSLDYCSYLGGNNVDNILDITVDTDGNPYVTGITYTSNKTFPTVTGPDTTYNGGDFDAFVAKFMISPGTWYVDASNHFGPWDGTKTHPFQYIQDAIDMALDHDTIQVLPGIYKENISFEGKALEVKSTDGAEYTIINGSTPSNPYQGCVVKFTAGEGPEAVLDGFTLTNGYGALIGAGSDYKGGGILCISSSPTIRNNVVVNNAVSPGFGGGIYTYNATPTIVNNLITNNSANGSQGWGGGVFIHMLPGTTGSLDLSDNIISENSADEYGGGVFVEGEAGNPHWPDLVIVENNQIMDNTSQAFVGGIYCQKYAAPMIRYNEVSGNKAVLGAGGIGVANFADPTIDSNLIRSNQGNWGGGNYPGGGIRLDNNCSATIVNNIIAGNSAAVGAGVHAWYITSATLVNNTITGNTATDWMGGGIAYYSGGGTIEAINNIIWDNPAEQDIEVYMAGGSINFSYCDLKGGQAAISVISPGFYTWGAGMIDADPLFIDSPDSDYHITYNSPCKEGGTNSAAGITSLDFEGDPRIAYSIADMGADEFYPRLYYTGDATPTGDIKLKFVGVPGHQINGLIVGINIFDPPLPCDYGLWYMDNPFQVMTGFGSVPGNGIRIFPGTVPATMPAPLTVYLQAAIDSWLTNLCVIEIE